MKTSLLVCDLDNTLYDWVGYFVPSFYAMVDEVVRITGCDREQLLDDFRIVHQRHHNSEHPFALLETRTIQQLYPEQTRKQVAKQLDRAFHAFNANRKAHLRLYPGVMESLESLSGQQVRLIAHTESSLFAVVDRLTKLGIVHYFSKIYCRQRPASLHPSPEVADSWLSRFPMAKVIELSRHQRKPNPAVLLEICDAEGITPARAAYVGDSLARDIMMAKSAGICAIWAKYGASHQAVEYEKLVRITHWTAEDVVRERKLSERARGIDPDYILQNGFDEVITVLLTAQEAAVGG